MNNSITSPSRIGSIIKLILAIWFVAAFAVGFSRAFYMIPWKFVAATIWLQVLLILLAFGLIKTFREWVLSLDLRVLIAIHLTRLIAGILFLIYHAQGRLPYEFAVPGGWGDIAVAVAALVVISFIRGFKSDSGKLAWWLALSWNVFGLIDIIAVVLNAMRIALADLSSMAAMTELPLSLLPTFLVPIIITTHIFIFASLRRKQRGLQNAGRDEAGRQL